MVSQGVKRRRFALSVSVALCGTLAGCSGGNGEGDNDGENQGGSDGQSNSEDVDADHTILVGPDGEERFEPAELEIDVGDAVEFVWESDNHTLIPVRQPDESEWDSINEAEDEGFVFTHTFDVEGVYLYYCAIHGKRNIGGSLRPEGMEGQIVVGDVDPEEVLGNESDGEGDTPYASFSITDADPDANEIEMHHAGGATIPAGELQLTITVEGTEDFSGLLHEATDELDEDTELSFGDTWIIPLDTDFSEGDEIVIRVVHEPTGELLSESSYRRW